MLKKDTYILGINLSHDGSACILKNGKIAVAIEKERITRIKHDGGNDKLVVEYCLKALGITMAAIDLVVQNANFEKETLNTTSYGGPRAFGNQLRAPVVTISHHIAHAYSAIGTCPFDTFNIMVLDGSGSPYYQCDDLKNAHIPNKRQVDETPGNRWCEKASVYNYNHGLLTPLYKDFSEFNHVQPDKPIIMPTIIHSVGGVYQAMSRYCFGSVDATGKLMGLAPYGTPGAFSREIFELRDGRFFNRFDWMNGLKKPYRDYTDFKSNFQYYADIAHWVQSETERALLYFFSDKQQQYPADNWAYAGGVALNAVANQRILAETGIKNLYIQPAAADNGIAIGCAYYGWLEVLKNERIKHDGKSNFGYYYSPKDCQTAAANYSTPTDKKIAVDTYTDNSLFIDRVAQLLADGNITGWFSGSCEFGPRALGYRSILAHPLKPGARDYINREIKNREDFRPFAPAVLREGCTQFFKYDWNSPYMVLVNPVKPEWQDKLANVVHLNGTARVQTVSEEDNPLLYSLLKAFKKITGIGMLLNTSFNNRGMPIIETPEQALDFFASSRLDYLIFENTIISKAND